MTKDELIEMARQVWLSDYGVQTISHGGEVEMDLEVLEAFAKRVRNDYSNKHAQLWLKRIDEAVKAEREACAKVCDDSQAPPDWNLVAILWIECKKYLAKAIRARGEA